jgi:hypothetical protein
MIEDRHAESWGQVCWVLGWTHKQPHHFFSLINLLLLCFFSLSLLNLTSNVFLLFYSLKSLSLDLHCPMFLSSLLKSWPSDLHCPMFPLKSQTSDSQTHNSQQQQQQQQQRCHSCKQPANQKPVSSPSASLLYLVVNKEVEQQFSGRGVTL